MLCDTFVSEHFCKIMQVVFLFKYLSAVYLVVLLKTWLMCLSLSVCCCSSHTWQTAPPNVGRSRPRAAVGQGVARRRRKGADRAQNHVPLPNLSCKTRSPKISGPPSNSVMYRLQGEDVTLGTVGSCLCGSEGGESRLRPPRGFHVADASGGGCGPCLHSLVQTRPPHLQGPQD